VLRTDTPPSTPLEGRSGDLAPADIDRLDGFVRRDKLGVDARYIAAVSSEAYERAFAKKVAGTGAHRRS
jgi:hypothetical protein